LKSAITCYLHFLPALDAIPPTSYPNDQYSLVQYFVEYFSAHLASVKEHPQLLPSLRLLLDPSSAPFHSVKDRLCLVTPDYHRPMARLRDPALNLLFAAYLRLPQACRYLFGMKIYPILTRETRWSLIASGWSYDTQLPPLIQAASCGDVEMMQVLLDARADDHYSGADPLLDGHALKEAVIRRDIQIVRMLLEASDEATGQFRRSLYLAIDYGYKEILIALLAAGANAIARNSQAICYASSTGTKRWCKRTLKLVQVWIW
jgi:hypothetical protein